MSLSASCNALRDAHTAAHSEQHCSQFGLRVQMRRARVDVATFIYTAPIRSTQWEFHTCTHAHTLPHKDRAHSLTSTLANSRPVSLCTDG
jgi:hypothetical protein